MMFTGIVAGTGRIAELEGNDVIRIVIDFAMVSTEGLEEGASVSVDGVCLTSLDTGKKVLKFDAIEETLLRTNLKDIKKGSLVNLERSITSSTEIGGHLMSGHIHCTGKIKKIIKKESTKDILVSFPKKYGDYIFYKTKTMTKPQFYKLKDFKENYVTCDANILIEWIRKVYNH